MHMWKGKCRASRTFSYIGQGVSYMLLTCPAMLMTICNYHCVFVTKYFFEGNCGFV